MVKRKKRSRLAKVNKAELDQTPSQLRSKLPKELIEKYLNLFRTQVLGKEYDFEYYEWTEKAYKAYRVKAEEFLGKMAEDPIGQGRLIIKLHQATEDLKHVEEKTQKKKTKDKRKKRTVSNKKP